ncbi:hypothetical protein AB2B38_005315 [Balneola sp. MJW-20]|uniref:hypothetical protein n=1 Tax=Gracilimonas aurantiaca TaxID=3234185 RepID=UPI00346549A5
MEGLKIYEKDYYDYEGIRIVTSEIFRGTQFILHSARASHIRSASVGEYFHGVIEKFPYSFDYISDFVDGCQRITAVSHSFLAMDRTKSGAIMKCTREIDLYKTMVGKCTYISSHPSEEHF